MGNNVTTRNDLSAEADGSCPHCKGRGKRSIAYTEILEASGLFYDQNMVRELRTITVTCCPCKGTGKVTP